MGRTRYKIYEPTHPHFKLIRDNKTMIQKINYIHTNPIKIEYIDEAKHWRYSSARDYEDMKGLINVERFC